jgi:NADH:ubiquinone oxidoreductase subunit 2 (subunit N)
MTAIGLLLLLAGFALVFGQSSEILVHLPERVQRSAVPLILAGAVFSALGIVVKIAQVMP